MGRGPSEAAGALLLDVLPTFPRAACRGRLDLPWLPSKLEAEDGPGTRACVLVCASCPHIAACAAFAISEPTLSGIWGGLTSEQRQARRAHPELVPA